VSRDAESADGILGDGKQIAPLLAVELENGYERSVILGRVEYGCQERTKGRDKNVPALLRRTRTRCSVNQGGDVFCREKKGG